MKKHSELTREQAVGKLVREVPSCSGWFTFTFQQQCAVVENAQPGSEWINVKTGKRVRISSVKRWDGVTILHEGGRITTKGCHYFAYDYCPASPEASQPAPPPTVFPA